MLVCWLDRSMVQILWGHIPEDMEEGEGGGGAFMLSRKLAWAYLQWRKFKEESARAA